jgi:hypothetical protein
MSGLSGNLGYKSRVFTAANAGAQIGVCSPSAATATLPKIDGFLHTINIGADSASVLVQVYDGTSTAGALLAQISTLATTPGPTSFAFDVQANIGLFIVITGGGTSIAVNVSYA